MGRVALIGENSVEYINILLEIWNNGDCAVLIDCQTPLETMIHMLQEAKVEKCYIESRYYHDDITMVNADLVIFSINNRGAQYLPIEVSQKFKNNYTKEEAIIIYSSGTTGKSKGIILSHYAINTNADAIIDYMCPTKLDCIYIVKSITHSSSITGELLVALKTHVSLLVSPVIVPPRYILNNISNYNVSIMVVNPTLLSMYAKECAQHNYDISSLKRIYVCGSKMSDTLYAFACDIFDAQKILGVYGLSEAAPRVSAQRNDSYGKNTAGKPIQGVQIAVVDELGCPVARGNLGIIHVNSPSIFNGYVCGTMKHSSLYKGWLNTGDMGYLDEYGELHVVDRVDDVININSHKIYPSEIENQVQKFADVQENSVRKINIDGDEILCCIYSSFCEIRQDIKTILANVLMKHEIPKIFIKVDSIPRSNNGKVSTVQVKELISNKLKRK